MSAHQFKYYNKLSGFGDDHIISWLKTAPASWNKVNMMAAAKRMGFELRDESPRGVLAEMEFLSKFARKPTEDDIIALTKAGVSVPRWVAYHNRKKLTGKMAAPSKSGSHDYRVKRLISYLDLTAHHPDIYEEAVRVMKVIAKGDIKWPYPSYDQVLRNWYNDKNSYSFETDKSDEQFEEVNLTSDYIYHYGDMSFLNTVANLLSMVPDLLNPAIFNAGYLDTFVARFGKHLSWPLELLRRSNGATSMTYVSRIASRTPYAFLANNTTLINMGDDSSNGKLLVAHWLFCLLRWRGVLGRAPTAAINSIAVSVSSIQFAINAHVQEYTARQSLPLYDLILVSLLSYVPDLEVMDAILQIRLPNISLVVDQLFQAFIAQVWSRVPANFKGVGKAIEIALETKALIVVKADTGTGKSTTMIKYIFDMVQADFKRVVVLVPRALLAAGIPPYVRSRFGLDAVGLYQGTLDDLNHRVIYTTPIELSLHEELLRDSFIIVDECHINEPAYIVAKNMVKDSGCPYLFASATPKESDVITAAHTVSLGIAQVWAILDEPIVTVDVSTMTARAFVAAYKRVALDRVRASHPSTKFLVFFVDVRDAENFAADCGRLACVLSSKNKTLDVSATVIIATSVADVGVTIPDVDWVITSAISRQVISNKDTTSATLYALDKDTIRQRRGRGGRTSNSTFTLVQPVGTCDWLHDFSPPTPIEMGTACLASGMPPATLLKFHPSFFTQWILNKDYEPSDDPFLRSVLLNLQAFTDAADSPANFRMGANDVDDKDPLFISHSTVLYTKGAINGIGAEDNAITAGGWARFILNAAGALASRDLTIDVKRAEAFIRSKYINDTEVNAWIAQGAPQIKMMRTATSEFNRFGKGAQSMGGLGGMFGKSI